MPKITVDGTSLRELRKHAIGPMDEDDVRQVGANQFEISVSDDVFERLREVHADPSMAIRTLLNLKMD